MATLSIKSFTGMIPRLTPERLPDGAAEYAENCDFSYGELRSIRGPGAKWATSQAVRAIWTADGSNYFTWDEPTRAYLAPTIDDTWGRVYFCGSDGLWVAQRSLAVFAGSSPGSPSVSYRVGVAPPIQDGHAIVKAMDDSHVYAQVMSSDGVVLREVDVTGLLVKITYWEKYSVTPPSNIFDAVADSTPRTPDVDGWVLGTLNVNFTWTDSGASRSEPLLANAWWINSAGEVKAETSGGGSVTRITVESIVYNGITYSPSSKLFAALTDGTARSSSLRFRAKIAFATTGKVFFDGVIPHVEDSASPGSYILTVPDSISGKVNTVACVATAVNVIGEESFPAGPVLVEWRDNGTEVIEMQVTHTPDAEQIACQGINFYRTYANSSEYFLVNDTPIPLTGGVATISDASTAPQTATTLQTTDWDQPPTGLKYLTYAGNGSFAGASGKDLCLSEPYHPHAWPYKILLPYDITGIIEVEGGLLVTTTLQPYFIYGSHPSAMTQQPVPAEQAGVGWRAMTRVSGAAVYASNDGLVRISGGQASLSQSQQLYTREVWRDKYKSLFGAMALASWDGKLIAVIDGYSAGPNTWIWSLEDGAAYNTALSIPGSQITGIGISAQTDQIGILYEDGFAEFGVGAYLPLIWTSKVYEYPTPTFFGCAIVRYSGTITVKLYADGVILHTESLPVSSSVTEKTFRLPPGRSKRFQIRIEGTGVVTRVELASSTQELQRV